MNMMMHNGGGADD